MNENIIGPQLKTLSSSITLGLSFWEAFRKEVLATSKSVVDWDDRPYFSIEEKRDEDNGSDISREVQQLKIRCGCFEFCAVFDPMSLAIVYAIAVVGLKSVLRDERVILSRGTIAVSHQDETYIVRATPPIKPLALGERTCNKDECLQVTREIGRWACGAISLCRLEALQKAIIDSDWIIPSHILDAIRGNVE
jgi:hypothetical protein